MKHKKLYEHNRGLLRVFTAFASVTTNLPWRCRIRAVRARLDPALDYPQATEQAGLQKNFSTIEHQILEKS